MIFVFPQLESVVNVVWTDELLDMAIEGGYMLCGNPEEVCEQVARYQEVGCDQVIPEYDRDRTHSTDRYRATAQRRFPDFQHSVPEGIDVSVIPTTALLPLG